MFHKNQADDNDDDTNKPLVFGGQIARQVQQAGEKLTDFLGELQQINERSSGFHHKKTTIMFTITEVSIF